MRKYVILIVLILYPLLLQSLYFQRVAVMALIYSILALSLGMLVGQVRLVSIGHAAFFGMGAYTSALLTTRLDQPFLLGFVSAAILTSVAGFLIAASILKLKGHFLGLGTLAFGTIFQIVMLNWESVTNGPNGIAGIPYASLFGYELDSDIEMYYFTALILVLLVFLSGRLYRSPIGRAFNAIREDEIVASTLGVNVFGYKILAFTLSAGIAGIAGSLYAHYMVYINYDTFTPFSSFMLLAMVVIGGMSTLYGPIVGAVLLTVLPELLRGMADYRMLYYGIILVVVILVRPEGLLGKSGGTRIKRVFASNGGRKP